MKKLKRILYGWKMSDAETYRQCYRQYGGSINVNPDVLDFITQRTGKNVAYFHREHNGEITGAYPVIDESTVGARVWNKYPLSYDDVLFPMAEDSRALFPERCNRISPFLKHNLLNINYKIARKGNVCIIKDDFSSKAERNRRNEYRKFVSAGGVCLDQSAFSATELARLYTMLFNARFAGEARCHNEDDLADMISALRHLIFGNILFIHDTPCAMDLVLCAKSENLIYFDVPNGGLNPSYSHLSPGSLLMWKNIHAARALCEGDAKRMIFSIGAYKKQWSYKLRWAYINKTGKSFL